MVAVQARIGTCEARLREALSRRRRTLLGVGPMSKNCVDAVVELGFEVSAPLILVASRRQIEAKELGGGYVNGWTTESFAKYVRENDKRGNILLARDHGGPWQNYGEVEGQLDLTKAMSSCKRSFDVDIAAGFDILHLDPSIDIYNDDMSQGEVLSRLFELYEYCYDAARRLGRKIIIEVGTEEQTGGQQDIGDLNQFLDRIHNYCWKQGLPKPFFVVVQTGTKVKETRNVGNLDSSFRGRGMLPPEVQIARLVDTCEEHGVYLKEHNTDYLSDDVLAWHPRAGIHATNVAPEFGVAETRHLLKICSELGLIREEEQFLKLAFDSGKWRKWLLEDSGATDYDKAVMAGHYVFGKDEFAEIKKRMSLVCGQHGIDLDGSIRACLKHCMRRYLYNFNLL